MPPSILSSPNELVIRRPGMPFSILKRINNGTVFDTPDHSTVVISVDGACSGNGTPSARGGWGVYFGPDSPYNMSYALFGKIRQTSQRAEITAAAMGLGKIAWCLGTQDAVELQPHISRVIVVSDSQYMVDGMTDWVYRWKKNGWRDNTGRKVVNAAGFQLIEKNMGALASNGIRVQFWKVGRERNTEADALAGRATRVESEF